MRFRRNLNKTNLYLDMFPGSLSSYHTVQKCGKNYLKNTVRLYFDFYFHYTFFFATGILFSEEARIFCRRYIMEKSNKLN